MKKGFIPYRTVYSFARNRIVKGFTLVELLVVISIIGILIGAIFVGIQAARERSKINKAKIQVSNIAGSVNMLYADTRMYPMYYTRLAVTDVTGGEVDVSNSDAGLINANFCGDGQANCFDQTTWKGPYYLGDSKDPWGHEYQVDYDYYGPPFEKAQLVVVSKGKDNIQYSCDDIYYSLASKIPVVQIGFLNQQRTNYGPCNNFNGRVN